ncbi:MAG: N-6 DNA methylase [Vulcanimicrobiaceae bacterium]
MLDTATKRRIDSARDILVGKVPDPKSQVEQITIALIYKFMDDMDADSEELGGQRKFFTGDYARYGWARLMRSGLGGHETLNLYAEGIAKMPENAGIPPLFRDIFKNAYLPYRDPETLKSFLKIIDEFAYDHSERLGDAFEYLLSVLGSQGDAGQFRTPRHIIDFMVDVLDPQKTDTVLDPACGTAGFLISSWKHILKANSSHPSPSGRGAGGEGSAMASGDLLTPDERARLARNFKGYDISPDMVRLSLVNLYLHGFSDPHIVEYDTLTSDERWHEHADVILANPPFMSPKGGIKPHKRFSIQAKRSEVLFVDYMAEHLTPNGRAGIIVPEGIIFQSQTAYTQLRKLLVEQYLVAVVSLPAGVFQPYSGVKTSILILDKSLAKQSDSIAFFKVENDGYGLGAQRRAIDKNDLPAAAAALQAFRHSRAEAFRHSRAGTSSPSGCVGDGNPADFDASAYPGLLVVEKSRIAANGDYNLSGERYREGAVSNTAYPLVPVSRFMKEGVKTVDPRAAPDEMFELWSIPAFDAGSPELLRGGEIGSQKKLVSPGDVLLSRIIPHIRRGWVVRENSEGRRQIASTEWIVFSSPEVVPGFLRQLLVSDFFHVSFMQTITGVGGSLARANPGAVGEIKIPLPPLEVQKEIAAEIEGYQKVIDGARAVLDHYRPHIPIHPDWPMVELGEAAEFISGYAFKSTEMTAAPLEATYRRVVKIGNVGRDGQLDMADAQFHAYSDDLDRFVLCVGDVVMAMTGATVGKVAVVKEDGFLLNQRVGVLRARPIALQNYMLHLLCSAVFYDFCQRTAGGGAQGNIAPREILEYQIPLPPLATQQAIVAEIEAEQALVAANRELITRFETKIQATLARIWGETNGESNHDRT